MTVMAGGGTRKSAKIAPNFGGMKERVKPTMMQATEMTTIGENMADLMRRFRDWLFSLKSARRWRMASRAPPASPALIMLQYSRSKAFGCLANASERV